MVFLTLVSLAFAQAEVNFEYPEGYSSSISHKPLDWMSSPDVSSRDSNSCGECPPEGIAEGEPICYDDYEDQYNSGCGAIPEPLFTPINFDEVICATSGTFLYYGLEYRDTDWYEIVLPEFGRITWTVTAEFPVMAMMIDPVSGDCSDYEMVVWGTGDACDTVTVTSECLPSGPYWFWFAPSVFSGVPCGLRYLAEATYEACPPLMVPQHVVIEITGSDVCLAWNPDGNPYYRIYSDTDPMGTFAIFEGTTSDTTLTIVNGAVGDSKRFYRVMGSDSP